MSRLGAKVRRGTSSVPVSDPVLAKQERAWWRTVLAAEREYEWRQSATFGPRILAAATVAAWLVIAAIVVACVAAIVGDAPARVRQPVGFDTITEGA